MESAQQGEEVNVEKEEEQVREDTLGEEDCLPYLRTHDGKWLARTLRERCEQLGYHGRRSEETVQREQTLQPTNGHVEARSKPDTSLAGPQDATAPDLPPCWVGNEHVALLRSYPWHTTELGPMSQWSIELRRMVNFTLQDRRSAVLWWGPMRRCEQINRQGSGQHMRRRKADCASDMICVYPLSAAPTPRF